jgi:histone H3/H4
MKSSTANQSRSSKNIDIITNLLRTITMLEKALERKVRQCFLHPGQYPLIYFEIQSSLFILRSWVENYKVYCGTRTFHAVIAFSLENIAQLAAEFILTSRPKNGAKPTSKSRLFKEHESISRSINNMIDCIRSYLEKLEPAETVPGIEIEKALFNSFAAYSQQQYEKRPASLVSQRGEKTIIFPWSDKANYINLVNDRRQFRQQIVGNIHRQCTVAGHKSDCNKHREYRLRGFRSAPRKTIMEGGKQEIFPIRMVECKACGQKFSLLPSFLPREKHFGIDIIGNILRGILLSANSLSSALENMKLTGRTLKSRQTLLNWIAWMGFHHPAALLTRAGVKGSGYFQEDEGFEKEPGLRTYTVAMVDSETLVVWHLDYIDHVNEQALCSSFEKFIEHIDFNVLGISKDKWKASTNALKACFHGIWIGFCHRHCLKKFRQALNEYQQESQCSRKEVKRLYRKFRKILDSATSKVNLKVKINLNSEAAFKHPSVRRVIEDIMKNAVHYTVHNKRKGIKKTTSLVDKFLKIIKSRPRYSQI